MTPADRLVVALDVPAPRAGELFARLSCELGITRFKVNAATLLEFSGRTLINNMLSDGARLMLDLKVYDIDSTVERIVRQAHVMGAEMITVHTRSVGAAVQAASRNLLIIAVDALTSDGPWGGQELGAFEAADGIVCHPASARYYREHYGEDKLIVCPGIRQVDHTGDYLPADDHVHPMSPFEAIRNGADLIVVGRPITGAADPVAAARAIVEEIEGKL